MRRFSALLAVCVLARGAAAKPAPRAATTTAWPYVLERRGGVSFETRAVSAATVALRNTKTGRVLWTRQFSYYGFPFWSRDHRAFALAGVEKKRENETNEETIFVWRQGERVRQLSPIAISTRLRLFNDTVPLNHVIDGAWSPDKRRLLLLLGEGTNGLQEGEGYLCACTFGRNGHARFSAPTAQNYLSLGHFRWRDSRTALYFPLAYTSSGSPLIAKMPRTWRVP